MRELVGKAEAQPTVPVLHYELVHINGLEITCKERVNLEIFENTVDRDDLDLVVKLNDLFDRHRQRALLVEFLEERNSTFSQVIIRENSWTKGQRGRLRLSDRVDQLIQLLAA